MQEILDRKLLSKNIDADQQLCHQYCLSTTSLNRQSLHIIVIVVVIILVIFFAIVFVIVFADRHNHRHHQHHDHRHHQHQVRPTLHSCPQLRARDRQRREMRSTN